MHEAQKPDTKQPSAPIKLTVVSGDLAFARYPLLIGHYTGDALDGAEARLDQILEGELTLRRQMGLYPSPIESSTVIVVPKASPPGAVVVGLGERTQVEIGPLRQTVRHGILDFVATATNWANSVSVSGRAGGRASRELRLSALVIGVVHGRTTRERCVEALLQAAAEAQETLADCRRWRKL
jgi:hypothetical protein